MNIDFLLCGVTESVRILHRFQFLNKHVLFFYAEGWFFPILGTVSVLEIILTNV